MNRMTVATLLRGVAPIALLAISAEAAAQSTEPEAAEAIATETVGQSDNGSAVEEAVVEEDIVVVGTAGGGTRRQDAAFAVTTIGEDALDRAAPASTADLLRTIPGVSAESSGGQNGANIFVRGYPSGGDAQFVTFQIGGVPVFPPPTLSFLENSQVIRLDETVKRVEAVRGGTGALFASGQPGLTVNVVPRTGGSTFEGATKFSITDYGGLRGDAWVSGPIDDDTGFMIGGYYGRSHGVRNPRFNAEKGGQISANLTHDFGDSGTLMIYGRYLNDHGQWLLPIPIVQNGEDISAFPGFSAGKGTLMGRDTRITTNNQGKTVDLSDGRGAKVGQVGLNFEYELTNSLKVRERMSYLWGNANTIGLVPQGAPMTAAEYASTLGSSIASLTYANGGGTVSSSQQVMHAGVWSVKKEIDSFVNDLALEWEAGRNKLTGGFYYADYITKDRWELGNGLLLTAEPNARRLNMTLANGDIVTRDGFAQGATYNVNASYSGKDYAFYLVDELQITDKLRLDGGIRWQRHEVAGRMENNTFGVDLDGNASTLYDNSTAVLNGTHTYIDYDHSAWSWTAGANYDITDNIGVFARYSVGRSFPQFDNLRENLTITSRVDTYEGGVKVSTPLLNLYATLFHNKFDGLATTQLINDLPVSSIGGAKATGVELEGAIRPLPGLSLGFGGTYLKAEYEDYFTGNGTIDNTGNRVQRQPRWSWRLQPSYEAEFGNFRPSIFATLQYTGDRFSDPENQQLLPHYYQLDAGLAFEVARIKFQVTGNNLTNEIGLTEGNPRIIGSQGSGTILARPILGRSFTFSAAYEF